MDNSFKHIYETLKSVHRRYYFGRIWDKTFIFLKILFLVLVIFTLVNFVFDVQPLPRILLSIGIILFYLYFSGRLVYPDLREIFNPTASHLIRTARRLGVADDDLGDKLVNLIQLKGRSTGNEVTRLEQMAIQQLSGKIPVEKFKDSLKHNLFNRDFKLVSLLLFFFAVMFVFQTDAMVLIANKFIYPHKVFREALPTTLTVNASEKSVLINSDVTLGGSFSGLKPKKLNLIIFDTLQDTSKESAGQAYPVSVKQGNAFYYDLKNIVKPFHYRFVADIDHPRFNGRKAVSKLSKISVISRPVIRNLQVKISPPKYTKIPASFLPPNSGDISAIKGSKALLRIETDKQLATADIVFSDSSRVEMKIAGHTAVATFPVMRSLTYSINITDTDSISNYQPIAYQLYPVSDEFPYAEIKQPGADVELGDELMLPLLVEVKDDFGFRDLYLNGELVRGGGGDTTPIKLKLPLQYLHVNSGISAINWDLLPLFLVPDDHIQYRVTIRDNDVISGPKAYQTPVYSIRIPSILETIARKEKEQEKQAEDIKEILADSKEIKEKLAEIQREMKKENKLNWEKKQELKNQLDRQQSALDKIEEIKNEVQKMASEMENKKLLSKETLDKYFELQKMMEKLATPELKKAMEELHKAMEQSDPNKLKQAMKNFEMSVEQFEKNIDRTYELMKQVQLEQMMDELVKLSEKIAQDQKQVNKALEKQEEANLEQLAAKEESIKKESELLKEQIKKAAEELQNLEKSLAEDLEKSNEFMDSENLSGKMQQMKQQMQNAQSQSAKKSGEQLERDLEMLQSMLQNAQQNVQNMQKQKLAKDMKRAMSDLLQTSFRQESVLKQAEGLSNASAKVPEIAKKQADIQNAIHKIISQLIKIGNQSFFLSPQMNQIMSGIDQEVQRSIKEMENRNFRKAKAGQKAAMGGLNSALLSLQSSMQQMSQSSSASGFQEFMKKMQQMSGQQGQLNQQSMSMLQQMQQGGQKPMPGELGKLAAQQDLIRKSMEQLSDGMGGERKDVLGRLGEMGKEMEKIIKDLKAQQLDRKVIERQERILSRMLDAQKSIREKEHSKRREAELEAGVIAKSPPELRRELLKKEDLLRKALMDALEEGYSEEYKNYIKKYFEQRTRSSGIKN